VAVLLNKCNLELIPRWVNHRPVNPEIRNDVLRCGVSLSGVKGLAEDVRFYGELVRKRVLEKIGHLYPQVTLPKEYGGREANVIAWLWARTVASPNPAVLGAHVPLINTYWLCSKKGHEAWLEPVIDTKARNYKFEICKGSPQKRTTISAGTQIRGGFKCLLTNTPIPFAYIRDEAINGRLQYKMIAIVAELPRGRTYVTVDDRQQSFATDASPVDFPDTEIPERALGFRIQNYGIRKHWQMFLPRQLAAMTTLSDFVRSVGKDVCRDAKSSGLSSGDAESYAGAITTFLALALDRCADFNNALCRWKPSGQQSMQLFGRQVIPMIWGFCEPNIMGEKAVCWKTAVKICADAIETIPTNSMLPGDALQNDAAGSKGTAQGLLVSTDPPYYDNVGYSDLSDFFYAWLRRTIGDLYPDLFRTILVPKALELTGAPERFGGDKEKARDHFESGFRKTFASLRDKMDIRFPLTVYYAFKQEDEQGEDDEEEDNGENETLAVGVDRTTGWETLLEALVGSGFQITATWPIRAVQKWRMRARSSNALASFIVLACRVRPATAQQCTRRDFLNALKKELPPALAALQQGNIAPVDLAQAAIGPGMAVFSRYSKIIESSDKPMTVRTALSLINLTLDEVLAESDAEYDADTRWALAWFEQYGMEDSEYGDAETLSRAKNTAVNGLEEAGIVISRGGKVRLLKRAELLQDWEPATDNRLTVWKATQYLIRALVDRGSETEAASLLRKMGGVCDEILMAYREKKS